MSPQVAVIVPVHNVDPYLRQCVDSILNQTYPHLKVILVDDGSTDRSGEICEEYASQDRRVVVVHKEYGGPSSARNAGLQLVSDCDYLTYVDSDDWIELDFVRLALGILEGNPQIDIVQAPFVCYNNETGEVTPYPENLPSQVCGREDVLRLFTRLGHIDNHAVCKLYRLDSVRGVLFQEGVTMENMGYTLQCFLTVKQIAWMTTPMYSYRVKRKGSIMQEAKVEETFSLLMTNLADLLSRPNFDQEAKGWINTLLYNHLYRAWVTLHRLYAGRSTEDYQRVREFFLRWARFSQQYPYYNVYEGKEWFRGELQLLIHRHPTNYLYIYELLKGK